MRNVKLFLASGNSLKKDRDEIMLFLANKNQFLVKHGIFLELVRWEFLSSSFSETRKQDDFNKELEESEIFTCLIFDRIGQYTREEFDKVYANYKQGKNPRKFYLYFKTLPKNKKEEAIEVYKLRQAIEKDEQIYREYKNPDQLKLFLNQNLDEDLPGILKEALLENIYDVNAKTMTETIPDYILDNLDDADKMLSKNLAKQALETYQETLKSISKSKNPELYAKIKFSVGMCYLNIAQFEESSKNLKRALFFLESALENEEHLKKINLLGSAYYELALCITWKNRESFNEKNYDNIIHNAEQALIWLKEEKLILETYVVLGECFCEKGRLKKDNVLIFKSIEYFQKVLKNSQNAGIQLIANANHYIGLAYINISKNSVEESKKIEYLHLSIEYENESIQNITPVNDNTVSLYRSIMNDIGVCYCYIGKLKKDPVSFEKALHYFSVVSTLLTDQDSFMYFSNINNQAFLQSELFVLTKNKEWIDKSNSLCDEALKRVNLQYFAYFFGRISILKGTNHLRMIDAGIVAPEQEIKLLLEAICFFNNALLAFQKGNADYIEVKIRLVEAYYQFSKRDQKKENEALTLSVIHEIETIYSENNLNEDENLTRLREMKSLIETSE